MLTTRVLISAVTICAFFAVPRSSDQIAAAETHTEVSAARTASLVSASIVKIGQLPQDITLPMIGGTGGNVVLPSNDAPPSTTLSVSTQPGPLRAAIAARRTGVVESITMTFDHNVTFSEHPSFYATLPSTANPEDPYILVLRDGISDAPIVTLDQFEYGGFVFLGGTWHGDPLPPFKTIAGHPYIAELVAKPPSMTKLVGALLPQTLTLPPTADISGSVRLPPLVSGGGTLLVRTSNLPPMGIPAPINHNGPSPRYYVTMLVRGTITYEGLGEVKLSLPATPDTNEFSYSLVSYDNGNWTKGWNDSIVQPQKAQAGALTFPVNLPATKLTFRRYAFALEEQRPNWPGDTNEPAQPPSSAPVFAIIGDSMSFLTAFPSTAPSCKIQMGALPLCQYTIDPQVSYPAIVARLTGYHVVNLAWPAIEIGGDASGESALSLEAPQVPENAKFVIVQAGGVDVVYHPKVDRSNQVDAITAAIHSRAPNARIVYVGQRYFSQLLTDPERKPGIDAWNARERTLAVKYGAYIDVISMFPAGINSAFPDGVHASADSQRTLASAIAAAMKKLDR